MGDSPASPFAILSMIVAPAILTNASSVLAMSTSNRLARAVDRARELARQIEGPQVLVDEDTALRLRDLSVTEDRAVLLLRALRSFYSALGAFASATLLSLFGAMVSRFADGPSVRGLEIVAVIAGTVAVSLLVIGSFLLFRETTMAVDMLRERTRALRARRAPPGT
jgi:hypothetical protein